MLSDNIENFIKELLLRGGGRLEIKRRDLAIRFNCSPSQINYVLTTRFAPHLGYYIESRRGEGGYIRIEELDLYEEDEDFRKLLFEAVGDELKERTAESILDNFLQKDLIGSEACELIKSCIDDRALRNAGENKNRIRADIMKNMLLAFLKRGE